MHQHFHCRLLHVSKNVLTLINFHNSLWLLNSSKVKPYTFSYIKIIWIYNTRLTGHPDPSSEYLNANNHHNESMHQL